jgi:hypothetical protein
MDGNIPLSCEAAIVRHVVFLNRLPALLDIQHRSSPESRTQRGFMPPSAIGIRHSPVVLRSLMLLISDVV